MGFRMKHIDPQHLELEALLDEFNRAVEEGFIDEETADWLGENEPQSVVFTGADLDEAYAGDFEEAAAVVNEVGSRDLDAKIRYWREALKDIESLGEDK